MGPGPSRARSRRTRRRRPARGSGMGSHQSTQVCGVVPAFRLQLCLSREGGGSPGASSAERRRAHCAQEVRSRSGRSQSPGFAGTRRVNRD